MVNSGEKLRFLVTKNLKIKKIWKKKSGNHHQPIKRREKGRENNQNFFAPSLFP